ncbi:MAG: hypothetical protein A3B68_08125 [Candidatus Melainabacteria bacterium RIFCSPHIGHO2_02_FULL_34_12]|nr:MAG: hypothetical protein A3B68_08125 [Candidatus Melainabacteria bacterium RIFCSPHIGHO2_02_FULL_34_12]
MFYDPKIHNRRSIRLKEYDYSEPGYYFLTICTHNRQILFENQSSVEMIQKWWRALPSKFFNVQIDAFIVMPDHIHGIINITVGADQRVCPKLIRGKHIGLPLPAIIQWYKTMTTNEYIQNVEKYNWVHFDRKLWQRNYYERIIRNEKELNRKREYVINNRIKHKQNNR